MNVNVALPNHLAFPHEAGIYAIMHRGSGKCYVGSSTDMKIRVGTHIRDLRAGKHPNARLQNAWNAYGEHTFALFILDITDSLLQAEQLWIDCLEASSRTGGFNLAPVAGSNRGFKHSVVTKSRWSAMRKGKKFNVQHRQAISNALKGITRTLSHRVALSLANTGKQHSQASKDKMSASHLNVPLSSEHADAARKAHTRGEAHPNWVHNKTPEQQRKHERNQRWMERKRQEKELGEKPPVKSWRIPDEELTPKQRKTREQNDRKRAKQKESSVKGAA